MSALDDSPKSSVADKAPRFKRRQPPQLSSTFVPDLTDKIIQPDDHYCEAGGFGDVFRCRHASDDGVKEVAVKVFRFGFSIEDTEHKRDGRKAARMIRRELEIWSRLTHRNIVPFLGTTYGFGKQGNISLVSMWMPHGTLQAFIEAYDGLFWDAHRLQLLLDIANGLHYLHSFPIVHGDLSSNNVLLDHDFNACLTDFGCASLVGELPEGLTYLRTSAVRPGTLRWAAPEHVSLDEAETKHTIKSDIYSFGNIALLVLSGKCSWSEVRADAAVVLRLSQGLKPSRPLSRPIDDQHWAFIEQCWSSIAERPVARDAVSTLQQLLSAYPPPLSLRDLLGATTPSRVEKCPNSVNHSETSVAPGPKWSLFNVMSWVMGKNNVGDARRAGKHPVRFPTSGCHATDVGSMVQSLLVAPPSPRRTTTPRTLYIDKDIPRVHDPSVTLTEKVDVARPLGWVASPLAPLF